ncbi:unnamed protein product [Caenorhabditis auriculariae]|uniref:Uncharacterized protein n=1 Tax=Caenorhabditis auriculariae TaxID=2777116 RepID=A0A8S1GZ11_9PELO|nr:unnamed protein product [Caenorhabditis auriculariae]
MFENYPGERIEFVYKQSPKKEYLERLFQRHSLDFCWHKYNEQHGKTRRQPGGKAAVVGVALTRCRGATGIVVGVGLSGVFVASQPLALSTRRPS